MKKQKSGPNPSLHWKSFLAGSVVGALAFWALSHRDPSLKSLEDKGSYAFGQKIGQNLKQGHVEVDSRIFQLGMEHARRDFSLLKEEEKQKGLSHIQNISMSKRQTALKENSQETVAPQNPVDADGFTQTPFGFSYRRGTWASFEKSRLNPRDATEATTPENGLQLSRSDRDSKERQTFWLTIRDRNGSVLYETPKKKPYSVLENNLPTSLQMSLTSMQKDETWLLKLQRRPDRKPGFHWPIAITEDHYLEIKKSP